MCQKAKLQNFKATVMCLVRRTKCILGFFWEELDTVEWQGIHLLRYDVIIVSTQPRSKLYRISTKKVLKVKTKSHKLSRHKKINSQGKNVLAETLSERVILKRMLFLVFLPGLCFLFLVNICLKFEKYRILVSANILFLLSFYSSLKAILCE